MSDQLVEDGNGTYGGRFSIDFGQEDRQVEYSPVTPTMTSGWAEKREKTTDPRTEARRTSLTPYSEPVF